MSHKNMFKIISIVFIVLIVSLPVQAGVIGTDQCLLDQNGLSGCTSNDIGIQSIEIVEVFDGCTDAADTATVSINMAISSAQPTRYDIGLYIDLGGGDAVATGNNCVHEALHPVHAFGVVPTIADRASGVGPYLNSDNDTCGDVTGGNIYERLITNGDIGTTDGLAQELSLACSDTDGNGYVNINWAATWRQNAATACSSISLATTNNSSKCQIGTTDTANGIIRIGAPELGLTISCTQAGTVDAPGGADGDASTVAFGEQTLCTVNYTNAGLVAASHMEFHVAYPGSQGAISAAASTGGIGGDIINTGTASVIEWGVGGSNPPVDNIPPAAASPTNTGELTYLFTSSYDGGIIDEPMSVTAYFNDGTYLVQQALSASTVVTLPVTIASVYAQQTGDTLNVEFSTASETFNAGFNVYAVNGNHWRKLNSALILGALNSLETQQYSVDFNIPANSATVKNIVIAGVDTNGVEDRHGPFPLNQLSGSVPTVTAVDWAHVKKQINAKQKAKHINTEKTVINIDVTADAVYSLSHSELLAAGVNLMGMKSSEIAISLRGRAISRYISDLNKASVWTKKSTLQFRGVAPTGVDALYLGANKYRLSLDASLVRANETPIDLITNKTLRFEENSRYSLGMPGDDPFYDTWFYTSSAKPQAQISRHFELPSLDAGQSNITVYAATVSVGEHRLLVSINGKQVSELNAIGWKDTPISFSVDNSLLKAGDNVMTLTAISQGSTFEVFVYDKLTVQYSDGQAAAIETPLVSLSASVTKKSIQTGKGADLLIVSHPLFIGETLDRFVTARENDGWTISVVDVEDVYAAYGYGMASPYAVKAYLEDAAAQGVSHVQLVGAASFDYHDYLNLGSVSFIGSIYTLTGSTINYTPCDTCLVMDADGLPTMAIGRWPVRTLEGLSAVVNKSLSWDASGQSSVASALFISDKKNGASFSTQMDNLAQSFEDNSWVDLTHVKLDAHLAAANGDTTLGVSNARSEIMNALNSGVSITSYSGHSSPSTWSFDGLLKVSDVADIQNIGNPTVALPLACYTTYADSPSINTLAHQLMAAGENGAVAVYGAATLSSISDNSASATSVVKYFLNRNTLGESVRKSKLELGSNYPDIIKNSNLLGDVTLRLDQD